MTYVFLKDHLEFERGVDGDAFVQPSSIDIPLGIECLMVKEKILPHGKSVRGLLPLIELMRTPLSETTPTVLLKGQTYLCYCGRISMPLGLRGTLSPKSSIGRVDLMVRAIYDDTGMYDTVPAGSRGELWMEISPRSFNVSVKAHQALSQMMVFRSYDGGPGVRGGGEEETLESSPRKRIALSNTEEENEVRSKIIANDKLAIGNIYRRDGEEIVPPHLHGTAVVLSLGLNPSCREDGCGGAQRGEEVDSAVGWEALPVNDVIDMSSIGTHDPHRYFRPVRAVAGNKITLEKDHFYILATNEKICVPPHLSAEMIPFSHHIGELRAHYAGFFDPGFGYGVSERAGLGRGREEGRAAEN